MTMIPKKPNPFKGLTKPEAMNLTIALSMRKCLIETGDWRMSSADAERQKLPAKALSREQMLLLLEIDTMMSQLLEV